MCGQWQSDQTASTIPSFRFYGFAFAPLPLPALARTPPALFYTLLLLTSHACLPLTTSRLACSAAASACSPARASALCCAALRLFAHLPAPACGTALPAACACSLAAHHSACARRTLSATAPPRLPGSTCLFTALHCTCIPPPLPHTVM